jgi:NAD(P)-dependent dehydrogenase (short-subunit alcohol dehydrogenase family)
MQNETVLVTGSSSGIGRATARAFLDDGWTVYATARNPADIQTLGEEGARLATLDVTDDEDVERVVDRIIEDEGRIDCLVNNAGYAQPGPVEDVPIERVQSQFDVNVFGPHRLIREALPHMRTQESGRILNVSSVVGQVSVPGLGIYCGSKFAMEGISDALRAEVAEYGIDVVLIEPGPVETGFADRANAEADGLERSGAYDRLYRVLDDTQALGGGGLGAISPEEVADTILDAANLQHPEPRYAVGEAARYTIMGKHVPASWRDAAYGFALKLVGSDWLENRLGGDGTGASADD